MKWSYGITAVSSRVDNLLADTIASLAKSGFPTPTLFIDGDCRAGLNYCLPVVSYQPNVGHLTNWVTALVHLYVNCPEADRYAIFEDDLLACPNLKPYLEETELPQKVYLNLLTHDQNLVLAGGQKGWYHSNQRGKGAVGLVFSRKGVMDLITSNHFVTRPAQKKHRCADGMVITALKPLGYVEWVHYPSLLQHVGITSAMGHKYGTVRGFVPGFDPMTLVSSPATIPQEVSA